jgi:CRISPR-associated protein Cas2
MARIMRILVMFDLPFNTSADRREYRRFRKYLITNGFFMMQESIYCKLVLNAIVGNNLITNVKNNKPNDGLVQLLMITEKQFSRMELIIGEVVTETITTDERLLIL